MKLVFSRAVLLCVFASTGGAAMGSPPTIVKLESYMGSTGVIDFMSLLPKDAPHLDGSLGLDIFARRTITFDESERTLTIETAASLQARIRSAQPVPIRLVRDAEGLALTIDVAVPTSLGMTWMELDSGNAGAIAISKILANLFHIDPDRKDPQPVRFEIAGGIPVEGAAITSDLIKDGNIGEAFLKKWVLTVDLASGRAWLSRLRLDPRHPLE